MNPELKSHFEDKGFRFVGQDIEGERMEVIELDGKDATPAQVTQNCRSPLTPPQTTRTSWVSSITLSSPPGPSSPPLLTWVCCWPQPGSCRATCRRAAACLHGNLTMFLLDFKLTLSFFFFFNPPLPAGTLTVTRVAAAPQTLRYQS